MEDVVKKEDVVKTENKEKIKFPLGLVFLAVVIGIPLLIIILFFILCISPIALFGFITYKIVDFRLAKNEMSMKLKYKLATDKNLIKLQYLQSKLK